MSTDAQGAGLLTDAEVAAIRERQVTRHEARTGSESETEPARFDVDALLRDRAALVREREVQVARIAALKKDAPRFCVYCGKQRAETCEWTWHPECSTYYSACGVGGLLLVPGQLPGDVCRARFVGTPDEGCHQRIVVKGA